MPDQSKLELIKKIEFLLQELYRLNFENILENYYENDFMKINFPVCPTNQLFTYVYSSGGRRVVVNSSGCAALGVSGLEAVIGQLNEFIELCEKNQEVLGIQKDLTDLIDDAPQNLDPQQYGEQTLFLKRKIEVVSPEEDSALCPLLASCSLL